jgi:hypothetical protein
LKHFDQPISNNKKKSVQKQNVSKINKMSQNDSKSKNKIFCEMVLGAGKSCTNPILQIIGQCQGIF